MSALGREREIWPVLLPVGFTLLLTLYTGLRFGYRWAETDTAAFIQAIQLVAADGTLTPVGGVYQHGYGYQSIVIAITSVTGLDLATVQLMVMPFLALVVAICAFVAFRSLTGSALLGGLAATLLFTQPEFLFVLQRGNHEKITHTLILLCVFILSMTLSRTLSIASTAASIVCFYALAWTIISINSFFGSSFLASIVLSLSAGLLALAILRPPGGEFQALRRLTYASLSCFVLLFIFIEYVYAPVRQNLTLFNTLLDRVALLLLSFEPQGSPYSGLQTGQAWVAPWVYPVLTSFNWVMIALSGVTWVWLAIQFRRHGLGRFPQGIFLLWMFSAAFAVVVAAAIGVDLAGFLGDNLQIRVFPLFMMFAIPLVVVGIARLMTCVRQPLMRAAAATSILCLVVFFATVGILKATNDPLVSNKWLFYSGSEQRSLRWADQQIDHQQIWTEFDERLLVMQLIHDPPDPERGNRFAAGNASETARYIALSDITSRRSLRLRLPLPETLTAHRIYDNGNAQVYLRFAQTPYQP